MKLIFGTKNKAKIEQLRMALKTLEIEVAGLPEDKSFPEVTEGGRTALENARKKAQHYARLLGEAVFSMDNALYLEGLPEDQQPGPRVRHINGRLDRPTDREIIEYYSKLIGSLGDKINGYWEYGVCVSTPAGESRETTFRSPRVFVSKPSATILEGYPLESLQIDPNSGKYSSEMSLAEKEAFYQERQATGQKLRDFISSLPADFISI